ncbi:MAG: hypothetical protein H8E38_13720 [SAR324 cluster bacterium]|nr:hypothetical protein [SAR324 cluster bacterium]
MDKNSILAFNNKESVSDVLNELLKSGAQKLIHNAVETELREFIFQLLTGIGPVSDHIPKIRFRDGEPLPFCSALVLPYVRKTRSLEAAFITSQHTAKGPNQLISILVRKRSCSSTASISGVKRL